jgi:hypothetical protein
MNQIWIVVVALVALLLITRIRSRRRSAQTRRRPGAGPRIQGTQVSAFVHPRMGQACLFDSGMQFGKGFRRKEGPQLPHDARCRCEVVPFSFTSSEVFNGALRNVAAPRSSIEGLEPADTGQLIERLKAVEAQPLPAAPGAYAAAVELGAFPAGLRPALQAFLELRHAFLQGTTADTPGGSDSITFDPVDTSEPT